MLKHGDHGSCNSTEFTMSAPFTVMYYDVFVIYNRHQNMNVIRMATLTSNPAKPCNGIPSTNCTGVLTKFPKYQNYNVCCGG